MECGHCGKKYFTNVIKVFVIKSRICPEDKVGMFSDPKAKTYTCPKCGKVIAYANTIAVTSLPVRIIDVVFDYHKRDDYALQGYDVEKSEEPEMQVCTKCANLRKHVENVIKNDPTFTEAIKKDLHELSNIEFMDAFFRDIQPEMKKALLNNPKMVSRVPTVTKVEKLK